MIFSGHKACNTESMVNMKICKMDKFIIAIVIACVAFIFSGCNEETSRQMESSNSTVTKESVKSQSKNEKINCCFREGYDVGENSIFDCYSPGIECLLDNRPKNIKYRGHVKIPSLSDIKVKNKKGANRSASDIIKIARRRAPGLRHVYNKNLKKIPGLQGEIALKFTIAPEGKITDVSIVSSTTQNSKFDAEIQQLVGSWVFFRVKSGETTVTIPFTFFE